MTARIEAHNQRRSIRRHPMNDRKFDADHTRVWSQLTGHVDGQLWQRVAEGKRRD